MLRRGYLGQLLVACLGLGLVLGMVNMDCQAVESGADNWGLVKVAYASVSREPDWVSERLTQVLLGEPVRVLEKRNIWLMVSVEEQSRHEQGYRGWVLANHVALGERPTEGREVRIAALRGRLRQKPSHQSEVLLTAYMNSRLAVVDEKDGWYRVALPGGKGRSAWISQEETIEGFYSLSGDSLVNLAEQFVGVPYLWGGMSVLGIDCSGLTYTAYAMHGLLIPRDADEQFQCGMEVELEDLQAGDLVFFGRGERVTHVGIYDGEGSFVHASSARGVRVQRLEATLGTIHYLGARRVIEP